MPDPDKETGRKEVDIDPDRRIIQTLGRRDVIPSIKEGVDNAIDGLRRYNLHAEPSDQIENARIDIRYAQKENGEENTGYIEIFDTCGGVPGEDLEKVLRPGSSTAENTGQSQVELPDSIGWAGVGAIRGALSIGRKVIFRSQTKTDNTGWEMSFTLDEYLDETHDFYREETDEIDPGTSLLRIEDVDVDFANALGENGENLKEDLAETYSLFMGGSFPGAPTSSELQPDFDLEIYVNNERINARVESNKAEYDWSYIPMDDLYPRHLYNWTFDFEFSEPNVPSEGTLRVDLTAGILQSKSDKRGLTVYVNRRKVLQTQDNGIERRFDFNKYRDANQGRLCIVVSIITETHPIHAPTTDEKDSLRFDSPRTERILTRISRLGIEYQRKADTRKDYGLPTAVTKAFPGTHPHAGNGGEIEAIDYTNRSNISHKPGSSGSGKYRDYPEVRETLDTIRNHANLGLYNPESLITAFRPAYEGIADDEAAQFDLEETVKGYYWEEFNGQNFVHINEPIDYSDELPPDLDIENAIEKVKKYAELSKRRTEYYLSLPDYLIPRYEEELVKNQIDIESLEKVSEEPDINEGGEDDEGDTSENEENKPRDDSKDEQETFIPEDASEEEKQLIGRYLEVDNVDDLDSEEAYERLVEFLKQFDEFRSGLPDS